MLLQSRRITAEPPNPQISSRNHPAQKPQITLRGAAELPKALRHTGEASAGLLGSLTAAAKHARCC